MTINQFYEVGILIVKL